MGLRNFWVTGRLNPIASFSKYVWVETEQEEVVLTVCAVSDRESLGFSSVFHIPTGLPFYSRPQP